MGEGTTIIRAGIIVLLMYVLYFGAIIAVLWAIWNWIVLPSLPYIHSIFWGA